MWPDLGPKAEIGVLQITTPPYRVIIENYNKKLAYRAKSISIIGWELWFSAISPNFIWFSFILWSQFQSYTKWLSLLNDKISRVFGGNYPFETNCHCQKCPVVLRNKLSFWKQTRPDTTSFLYDKKYDCRFEINRGHPIPILWKRMGFIHFQTQVSLSYRKESQSSFRSDSQSIISKWKSIHHFEKRINRHFETTVPHHFKTIVLPAINHPLI